MWGSLDGRKTVLGMVLVLIGQSGVFSLFLPDEIGKAVDEVFLTVGTAIGGVGLAHKVVKNGRL